MKNVILSAPTHIELVITEKCNHKCKHCYNSWRQDNKHRCSVSEENLEKIFEELILNKVNYVTLTGGEPLLEEELLFYIIEKLRANNIGIGLNTNLTLVSKPIIERLINQYNWGNTILTSLPGFTPEECDKITQVAGSFNNICNGIALCNDYGVKVGVNVVIKRSMIDRLPELIGFVKQNKIDMLSITRTVPPSYDQDNADYNFNSSDLKQIVDFMRRFHLETGIRVTSLCAIPLCLITDAAVDFLSTKCTAGIISCTINGVNGEVTPCAHNEVSYGNIYTESLQEIWKHMESWRNGTNIPKECHDCCMLSKCGGDCRLVQKRIRELNYNLTSMKSSNSIAAQSDSHRFDINEAYLYNHKTIIREEAFGAVVALGVNEFYIKDAAYKIIKELSKMPVINKESLTALCTINASFITFMDNLIKSGIIYSFEETDVP